MLWTRTLELWRRRRPGGANSTDERGAIAVISVMVALAVFGVAAITVDLSYAMQLRRKTQNAADAASIAGARAYEVGFNSDPAAEMPAGGMTVDMSTRQSNARMIAGREAAFREVKRFANANFRSTEAVWLACRDADIMRDDTSPQKTLIRNEGDASQWCVAIDDQNPTAPILRVRVPGSVDLSFGRVISDRNISVDAVDERQQGFEAATTTIAPTTTTIAPTTTTIAPTTTTIAPNTTTIAPTTTTTVAGSGATTTTIGLSVPTTVVVTPPAGGCPLMPIAFHGNWVAGNSYDIWAGANPGNFGWLAWAGAQSNPTLVTSLTLPGNSYTYVNPGNAAYGIAAAPSDHEINIGDWIVGSTGVQNSSNVRTRLTTLRGIEIVIPQWDLVSGTGANTKYRVVQFLRVKISSYNLSQSGGYSPGQGNRITAQILGVATC